jgi:hypothetical protein
MSHGWGTDAHRWKPDLIFYLCSSVPNLWQKYFFLHENVERILTALGSLLGELGFRAAEAMCYLFRMEL